jgi:glycosyltransferase involved in cell wall biosynthesis
VAARLAGVAHILGTFHVAPGSDLRQKRSTIRHRALEYVSNHCLDCAIAVSDATRDDWIGRTRLPPRRVVTIPNGVDANHFRRQGQEGRAEARRALGIESDGALLLGGVGRLDEVKGFDILLEAFAQLAGAYRRLHVVLAGRGPMREALELQAARLGIFGRVHFLGFRSDVRQVYEALDVLALSSLSETLSYALLEGMAMELPAVGSRVGGVPEVIAPGQTGFLVPPRDAGALAAALRPLLDSAELRNRMGSTGRQRVLRQFSEEQMVERTLGVYRQMLQRRSARWRQAA